MVQWNMVICKLAGRLYTRYTILRYIVLPILGLGLAGWVTACAPKLVGPTATSGHFFSIQAFPPVILLSSYSAGRSPTTAEVIVRVQDARGQPVDGVLVTFAVELEWAQNASISPSQVPTRGGVARAVFEARLTGIVHVMARVDNTTAQTEITVQSPPSPTATGAALSAPQPAATVDL